MESECRKSGWKPRISRLRERQDFLQLADPWSFDYDRRPVRHVFPYCEQSRTVRAFDVRNGMVADEQRLVRGHAATRERAAENLGVRFAHAFFLGNENRVERMLEAEHGEFSALHRAGAVRDDAELQPTAAQLGERVPHIVAE